MSHIISDLFGWYQALKLPSRQWTCGHCNHLVGGAGGFALGGVGQPHYHQSIYICPSCQRPTYFEGDKQVPGVMFGRAVGHLPPMVGALYTEARNCMAANAFTSAVLTARKLLMHIAVQHGAPENLRFIDYVTYLADNGFVPPNGRGWVDHIRKKGNEATHEILLMERADAEDLLVFLEMLLSFVFDFPARVSGS